MDNNRNWIIVILVVLVLAAGGYFAWAMMNQPGDSREQTTPPATTGQDTPAETTTPTTPAAQGDQVEINNFAYSPTTITVKKGTKVTWTNKDSVGHTVTFNDSGLEGSGTLQKDEQFSFTFDTVGTFSYFCKPHPNMKGTVEVVE